MGSVILEGVAREEVLWHWGGRTMYGGGGDNSNLARGFCWGATGTFPAKGEEGGRIRDDGCGGETTNLSNTKRTRNRFLEGDREKAHRPGINQRTVSRKSLRTGHSGSA